MLIRNCLLLLVVLSIAIFSVGCTGRNIQTGDLDDYDQNNQEEDYFEEDNVGEPEFNLLDYLSGEYDYVGDMIYELICVKKDGYYGYVDKDGDLKIPLKFVEASDFKNGRAVVRQGSGGSCGVIDTDGEYILEPKYPNARIVDEFIRIDTYQSGYIKHSQLYDLDGNEIIPIANTIFIGDSNRIVAYIPNEESPSRQYCTIFDYEGNLIKSFKEYIHVYGFIEGYAICKMSDYEYTYVDTDGNQAINEYFLVASNFENGMAVAATGTVSRFGLEIEIENWKVFGNSFETLYELGPVPEWGYEFAGFYNNYLYFKRKVSTTQGDYLYCMVDPQTKDVYGYYDYLLDIVEANAVIFRDSETRLYGLFADGELALKAEYNNIAYKGRGIFTMEQGTTETEYVVPNYDSQENKMYFNYKKILKIPEFDGVIVQDIETELYGLYFGTTLVMPPVYDKIDYGGRGSFSLFQYERDFGFGINYYDYN